MLMIYSAKRRGIYDFDIWLLFAGGEKSSPLPPTEKQVKVVRNLDCRQTSIALYFLNL